MICPRCKTENGSRTICTKCGYFLYRANAQNRTRLTKSQRAIEDGKIIGKSAGKILKIVWIIIVIVVMSFWLLAILMYLSGGVGLGTGS